MSLVKGQLEVKLRATQDSLEERRKENEILKSRANKSENEVEALKAEMNKLDALNC